MVMLLMYQLESVYQLRNDLEAYPLELHRYSV